MTVVYVFAFCFNTWEEGLSTISIHKTRKGALKARLAFTRKWWVSKQQDHTRCPRHVRGIDGEIIWRKGDFYNPFYNTAWRVYPVEVQE